MNIFEKIQKIRNDLTQVKIKKTGRNEYAGYDYFELDDFIRPLNELMQKYGMTAIPSFTAENASLTAINIEKPEETYTITSPFGSANLKGCHEVQNIGAVETYQRRYLYQAMFDIAEHDALNATQGKKEPKTSDTPMTLEDALKMPLNTKNGIKEVQSLTTDELKTASGFVKGKFKTAVDMVLAERLKDNG